MKEREPPSKFCIMTSTVRLHGNAALFCAPTLFLYPCLRGVTQWVEPNFWIENDLVEATATSVE